MFFLWLAAGCGDTEERVLARDGDPVAGARVFEENCAVCHGEAGEGGVGPDFRDGDDTEDQLADKLLWGWGAMDGFDENPCRCGRRPT